MAIPTQIGELVRASNDLTQKFDDFIKEYPTRQALSQHILDATNAAVSEATADAEAAAAAEADRAFGEAERAEVYADNKAFVFQERMRRKAALDLDFVTSTYRVDDGEVAETRDPKDLLTVKRATPKWVFGPNGKLREVPPDTVAREWDLATGEPLGALLEPGATNILKNSSSYGTAISATVEEETTGVFGGEAAHRVSINTTSGNTGSVRLSSAPITFGETLTLSVYLKAGNVNTAEIHVTQIGNNNLGSKEIVIPGDGFYHRFDITVTGADENSRAARFDLYPIGRNLVSKTLGDHVFFAACQLEEGSFATSYIPTAGAPVTRAADTMSRTMGAEFNPSAGTIFIEYESPLDVHATYGRLGGILFRLHDNGSAGSAGGNQFVAGRFSGNLNFTFKDQDGTGFDENNWITGPSLPYGQKNKIAICYNSGDGFIAATNGTSTTHAEPDLPSVNWSYMNLTTAYDGTRFLGHKSDVRYYPYAMTAAELEELTAL